MKYILPIVVFFAFVFTSCSNGAKDFNQQLLTIEDELRTGKVKEYAEANTKLNDLLTACNKRLGDLEFETDEEDVREATNLKTVVGRITDKIQSLQNEQQAFEELHSNEKTPYETIRSYASFLSTYENTIKKQDIESEYQAQVSNFIDGFSENINTQLVSLKGTNPEPNNSLFSLVSYGNDQTAVIDSAFTPDDNYDNLINHFYTVKNDISSTLSLVNMDITTAKGNSARSLKQQFDEYESGLVEARKRQIEVVKGLIDAALINQGLEDDAKRQIIARILRQRTGFWGCKAYDLQNDIEQAQDHTINVTSSRVEVKMKYSAKSLCTTDAKFRYYEGYFTYIFPYIRGKIESGQLQGSPDIREV